MCQRQLISMLWICLRHYVLLCIGIRKYMHILVLIQSKCKHAYNAIPIILAKGHISRM